MTTKTATSVPPETNGLEELHCEHPDCGKFMGYGTIENGLIIIKCHACKNSNIRFKFTEEQTNLMAQEIHCDTCDRFLYSAAITEGIISVRCRNCGTWHMLTIQPPPDD